MWKSMDESDEIMGVVMATDGNGNGISCVLLLEAAVVEETATTSHSKTMSGGIDGEIETS